MNNGSKEVRAHGQRCDDLYAPTPPLAAARYLQSECASRGKQGPGNHRILLFDIRKAFFYGEISKTVYIELPSEGPLSEGRNIVDKLDKAMYGTRVLLRRGRRSWRRQ